jgi:hypothetical protein
MGQLTTAETAACITPSSTWQAGTPLALSDFSQCVCGHMIPALFDCSRLYVDVESYPSFSNVTINSQIDGTGNFISNNLQYRTGGPCDIVIVRVFYQWPLIVTGLGYNIANLSGNKRLLAATTAFRNEPYGSSSSCI